MVLKVSKTVSYQQVAFGTWGRFNTPAGVIEFLETKARLGSGSTDAETRLTRFLKPVREALSTKDMDFNQLLQRDLDDHRVATDLVPYLMQANQAGPAFFPPIVTALLPFDGPSPLLDFPPRTTVEPADDTMGRWSGYSFGEAFKFEKAVNPDNTDYAIRVGRLSWNDEKAQMVIIDGQHRAMALLAIYRTINKEWSGSGERYKHFYEPVVAELLKKVPKEKQAQIFSNVELPVTILWFPEIGGTAGNHQLSARKLFVDVNKNARPPSESRVLLLSDTSLSAIFMRKILNTFRNDTDTLPVFAIEYDHPERDQASSAKWSAISNVSIIYSCVWRSVFGPEKYISDLQSNFRGKESDTKAAEFMRVSLKVEDVVPPVVEEGERAIKRQDLSDTHFPRTCIGALEAQLMKSWGRFVVRTLSELLPFKAHGEALTELKNAWNAADSISRLAHDSIFEGVGMYWTLKDSHAHWVEKNKIRVQSQQPKLGETDVVSAWRETEKRRGEFEKLRAKHYLGSTTEEAVSASASVYSIFSTHACQLGFVMAARSLALKAKVKFEDLEELTDKLIQAANAGIEGDAPGAFKRRLFPSKDVSSPLNLIPKLDTPFAVYFRYFWLELLGTKESRPFLQGIVSDGVMTESISLARQHYLFRIEEIFEDSTKRAHPEWPDAKVEKVARETARKELAKGLKKWFGLSQEDFERWENSLSGLPKPMGVESESNEPSGENVWSGGEPSPSLDELIGGGKEPKT